MPRSFDFLVECPVTAEQIHSAFSVQDYWLARLATFGGIGELESLTIDNDGCAHVVVVEDLRHELLPGLFAKLYPRDLALVQKETWSRVGGGLVRGEVETVARGAPGSGRSTVLLAPAPDGSGLKCTATVQVKVPLVGGQIESLVRRQMVEETPVLLRYTAQWITENPRACPGSG
jgi:hypothetical protein